MWGITMKLIVGLVIATCLLSSSDAMARDTRHMFSIAEALRSVAAEQRIDENVQLMFGDQPHPPVAKNLGTYTSNRKANAFGKSDKEACERAFLSAILSLQKRARREGGDAVVNIRSYYKKNNVSHQTKYMCGAGAIVAGVALRGDVVRLKK